MRHREGGFFLAASFPGFSARVQWRPLRKGARKPPTRPCRTSTEPDGPSRSWQKGWTNPRRFHHLTQSLIGGARFNAFALAWDPFFELGAAWTEAFFAAGAPVYIGNVLSPELAELLSIAGDASITHMYAPGTRRHIKVALKLGATVEEIMDVLKVCVAFGVQATNLAVPILAEELRRLGARRAD
jgi:alkylhydroperoxidase/carboxymuconolactone decarboxylase family protein YurZ